MSSAKLEPLQTEKEPWLPSSLWGNSGFQLAVRKILIRPWSRRCSSWSTRRSNRTRRPMLSSMAPQSRQEPSFPKPMPRSGLGQHMDVRSRPFGCQMCHGSACSHSAAPKEQQTVLPKATLSFGAATGNRADRRRLFVQKNLLPRGAVRLRRALEKPLPPHQPNQTHLVERYPDIPSRCLSHGRETVNKERGVEHPEMRVCRSVSRPHPCS